MAAFGLRALIGCWVAPFGLVGLQPGRFEPRVVKRRRDQYQLMVQPRASYKSDL